MALRTPRLLEALARSLEDSNLATVSYPCATGRCRKDISPPSPGSTIKCCPRDIDIRGAKSPEATGLSFLPGKNTKTIIIVALRGIREYLSPPKNSTAHICRARSARTDVLASLSLVWWHPTYAPLLPRIYLSCEPCAPLCPVRLCLRH